MQNSTIFILLFSVVVFLSGCQGWRLTGREFQTEEELRHPPVVKAVEQAIQASIPAAKEEQGGPTSVPVLSLRGVGVKTLFMVRLFIAGLYLPKNVLSQNALDTDVPKEISVKFYAKFSSRDFVNFTLKHIKPNITRAEFDSLAQEFNRMAEISPDIKAGDTLALLYEPEIGTSFIHNGTVKGTIQGALFSKAVFSTWIGPKPFDHIVKRQVLGIPSPIERRSK
jgi:hypothetical protein